jgi:hypothetical protein
MERNTFDVYWADGSVTHYSPPANYWFDKTSRRLGINDGEGNVITVSEYAWLRIKQPEADPDMAFRVR